LPRKASDLDDVVSVDVGDRRCDDLLGLIQILGIGVHEDDEDGIVERVPQLQVLRDEFDETLDGLATGAAAGDVQTGM
jgi:hypothetical protein